MPARFPTATVAAGLLAVPYMGNAQQEPLRVHAAVGSQQVYVGQQFLLQIQVQGTDQPDPVDISPLERDFIVSEAGGGASNSTSVSIVNGRMTRQVQRGYNLNYRLAARTPGGAEIPSLAISAAGRSTSTQPIPIRVLPPEENEDFKLRLSLSDSRAYIGQPVTLTAEWFIGREVQEFSFNMPLLDDRRFEVIDVASSRSASGQASNDLMEIALGDRRATARRGLGELGGRQYTVLRFKKTLVPRAAGRFALPAASVTFVTPRPGQPRRRDMLDDFFGGGLFSSVLGGQLVVETLAIPSNRPGLEVLDLPSAGRPDGFNGWIGEFQLRAEAEPTSVTVGEPITLSLSVRGTGMLANAPLPPLDVQPALVRDFNVPREIGAGESQGNEQSFTQTLRARHDRVTEIPAVELPYFDPKQGAYRIARSEPIPLEVEPSRIVTVDDAEGRGAPPPRQLEVESSEQGIAHNYVDASALEPMPGIWTFRLRPLGPLALALVLLGLPPLAYCGLLAVRLKGHYSGALRWRARSPRGTWKKAVDAIDIDGEEGGKVAEAVLAALREYLGMRLGGAGSAVAAWTFVDVETRLGAVPQGRNGETRMADRDLLVGLQSVFERCEAGSYAGVEPMDSQWKRRLIADASAIVDRIEDGWR